MPSPKASAAKKKPSQSWPASAPESWPLDKIIPYERNPRTHPESQIAILADLMTKYGVDQPIVVDENGVILKGHGRRLAAIKAKFATFPVVVHNGLSEADKRGIRIADNRVSLLSGWDDELLKLEMGELKLSAEFDMPLLGFNDKQLVQFLASPSEPNTAAVLEGLKFAVIVDCESEQQQAERLDQFSKMGLKCRALIS